MPSSADHLPHQVGEVAGTTDPVEQRPVAVQHRVPVHVGQAGVPEVAAHQPPRFGEGVLPQRDRVGLEPGPGQVDGDPLGRVVVLLVLGRQDPQLVAVLDHQPGAVAADVEPVELAGQFGDFALAQVEPFQDRTRRVVIGAGGPLAEHPGHRLAQPGEPALHGSQPRVPGLDHGDGHHAAGDTFGVDRHLGSFGGIVLVFVLIQLGRILAERPATRQRAERRWRLRGQRDQVGAAAERERQVEGLLVVDGIEAAPGDEGEVEAVEGEDRARCR